MPERRRRSVAERAAQREPVVDPQDGFWDVVIEDNDLLLQALERRETARQRLADPKRKYKEAQDAAKAMVNALDLPDSAESIRVGRHRIKRTVQPARSVAFETGAQTRLTFGLIE